MFYKALPRRASHRKKESNMQVYADNAATTKMSRTAIEAMLPYMDEIYGNPSSLHSAGQRAAEALQTARESIATDLNASPREIYFTSGGSEADNQAIISAARLGQRKGKMHIVSTAFEHHAVLHTLDRLRAQGFAIELLPVPRDGVLRPAEIEARLTADTAFVSVMTVNNEIGTIEPIQEIAGIAAEHKVLFHTDAVQAAGQLPINVHRDKIDMLSMSAHKFHGPRGIGVLYVRRGIRPYTLISGGAQEKGRRAGTENLPAIAGMAAALEDAVSGMEERGRTMTALRERLIAGLSKIPYSFLNGEREKRLPGNVSFCFEGIEGESLLLHLDFKGIAASSGSACTSGSLDPSHVLLACGLPHEIAHGSLRLTISADNTAEEMDYISAATAETVSLLRSMSPVWDKLERGELAHFER